MMIPLSQTNTQRVRVAMQALGQATRMELRAALPDMDSRDVDCGLDSLRSHHEVNASDKIPCVVPDGRTMQLVVYKYAGRPDAKPGNQKAARDARSRAAARQMDCGYEPGYFTALLEKNDWPPGFVSSVEPSPVRAGLLQTVQRRESDSATGKGWGSGVCVMPGTPGTARPQMMGRVPT